MAGPQHRSVGLTLAAVCCFLARAVVGDETMLPWPVSTSYASLDPEGSAAWMVTYLGAEIIDVNETMSCNATAAWVRMPGSGYEFHFISTPALANSTFSFADYVAYVDPMYGNLTEQSSATYSQFMDFHVGMITDDMTPFYEAFVNGHVDFFMVGQYPSFFDLFVEIPFTGAIFEITSQRLDIPDAPISAWDICQDRNASSSQAADNVEEEQDLSLLRVQQPMQSSSSAASKVPAAKEEEAKSSSSFPTLNWRKTTFAAPHPVVAQLFSIETLNAQHIQQGHPGVWAKFCAKISWVQFDYTGPAGIPYQLHFVDGYRYPPHDSMNIVDFASLQESQRDFDAGQWDEWANNRLNMWVPDLKPFVNAVRDANLNISSTMFQQDGIYSLVIDTTLFAGNVMALVSDTYSVDDDVKNAVPTWDFCPAEA